MDSADKVLAMRQEWVSFVNSLTSLNLDATEFDPQATGKRASPYVSLPHDRTLREYVWETSTDARQCQSYLAGGRHSSQSSPTVHGIRTQASFSASTRRRSSLRAHPLVEEGATSPMSTPPSASRPTSHHSSSLSSDPRRYSGASTSSAAARTDRSSPRMTPGIQRGANRQQTLQPRRTGATPAGTPPARSSSMSQATRPADPGVARMSKALMNFVYYHPGISREQAEALMKGQPYGTYLLRDGSNHRGFSLSAIDTSNIIRHFRVCLLPTNKLQILHCDSVFDDMQSLVEYYQSQNIGETTSRCLRPLARYFQVSYD
ncbi:hypothetical protein PTSG_02087 [Salpingoeca rosetta]|uniref:SH2 domain-containing protein n=1 Tax=Salpingoeca rosetta (strain ATCC 50818 / BSB-021) TaxID=946362 RepID=F2U2L3_SALR5|nr:uncharacterized protein PTSG_02087 [Salpingoeca rosetta]EGD81368.1 hypothetical protein PTSG_02087 [Salpingoeca rosetta]|eukprot:XP_004996572.1 hypothetical protein PTSG_02087 [Salpingoeca rosetta]